MQCFDLNSPADRVRFALEMYNLASALKRESVDGQTNAAVEALHTTVNDYKEDYNLTTFYSDARKRKRSSRSRGDQEDQSGGGRYPARHSGSAAHQLKAHGYELVPYSFEDESGGIWEHLIQLPPHICVVYRVTDASRTELIAKQVCEHSDEVTILKYLRTI